MKIIMSEQDTFNLDHPTVGIPYEKHNEHCNEVLWGLLQKAAGIMTKIDKVAEKVTKLVFVSGRLSSPILQRQ